MLRVLYEDNHLLVVDKPAEIATMGSLSGESMHSVAADYLRVKYNKPGKVFVGIVSRLDTVTSGVLVLARTSKAASRLAPQFGGPSSRGKGNAKPQPRATKIYLVAVDGRLDPTAVPVVLTDDVYKDDAAHRMRIARGGRDDAQRAQLQYIVLGHAANTTLLAVQLMTGRKHQIRLQFSDRGHGVLGDRKYGSERKFSTGIALHSWLLQIDHPTHKNRREFSADVPASWSRFADTLPAPDQLRDQIDLAFQLPPIETESTK